MSNHCGSHAIQRHCLYTLEQDKQFRRFAVSQSDRDNETTWITQFQRLSSWTGLDPAPFLLEKGRREPELVRAKKERRAVSRLEASWGERDRLKGYPTMKYLF